MGAGAEPSCAPSPEASVEETGAGMTPGCAPSADEASSEASSEASREAGAGAEPGCAQPPKASSETGAGVEPGCAPSPEASIEEMGAGKTPGCAPSANEVSSETGAGTTPGCALSADEASREVGGGAEPGCAQPPKAASGRKVFRPTMLGRTSIPEPSVRTSGDRRRYNERSAVQKFPRVFRALPNGRIGFAPARLTLAAVRRARCTAAHRKTGLKSILKREPAREKKRVTLDSKRRTLSFWKDNAPEVRTAEERRDVEEEWKRGQRERVRRNLVVVSCIYSSS